MSQSAKPGRTQDYARRGWAGVLHADAVGLTESAIRRAGFPDPSLVFRWADIAGRDTAEVARPIRCRTSPDGLVLTVRCEQAASVFLQHETRGLLERVNAYLGAGTIARIQIVTGQLAAAPSLPERAQKRVPAYTGPNAASPLQNALNRLEFLRRHTGRKTRPTTP